MLLVVSGAAMDSTQGNDKQFPVEINFHLALETNVEWANTKIPWYFCYIWIIDKEAKFMFDVSVFGVLRICLQLYYIIE